MDLFSLLLESAFSWGVGKSLDVLVGCNVCGEKWSDSIGNVQFNDMGCKNCRHERRQFTNACSFTVGEKNEIAQVGVKLTGGWRWHFDPSDNNIFRSRHDGWIFFSRQMEIRGLTNNQVVVTGEIVEHDSGISYSSRSIIYDVPYPTTVWRGGTISLYGRNIPEEMRDSRIYAIDLTVKSKYNDLLCEDRILANLW